MDFRPLHDRVLVRRLESEEKTAGGIIIPDTAQEKTKATKPRNPAVRLLISNSPSMKPKHCIDVLKDLR
jgi:hypothetical protein